MPTDEKKARLFDALPHRVQYLTEQVVDAGRVQAGPALTLSSVAEALDGDVCVRWKGRRVADFEIVTYSDGIRWAYLCHSIGTVTGFVSLSAAYRDLVSRLRQGGLDGA